MECLWFGSTHAESAYNFCLECIPKLQESGIKVNNITEGPGMQNFEENLARSISDVDVIVIDVTPEGRIGQRCAFSAWVAREYQMSLEFRDHVILIMDTKSGCEPRDVYWISSTINILTYNSDEFDNSYAELRDKISATIQSVPDQDMQQIRHAIGLYKTTLDSLASIASQYLRDGDLKNLIRNAVNNTNQVMITNWRNFKKFPYNAIKQRCLDEQSNNNVGMFIDNLKDLAKRQNTLIALTGGNPEDWWV